MSDEEKVETKIKFIPKKKRPIRVRQKSDDENEEDESVSTQLENLKSIQKLREKPRGVSVITLAIGEKVSKEEELIIADPFNTKNGGLINMSSLKSGKIKVVDDAYDTGIGTQFSAETNKRDEDEEMMKYIEEELSKRKGRAEKDDDDNKSKYCSPEEAALLAIPTHLRASSSQKSEEMLSNQMLSGIPEVDLGIEAKIKNIEATEDAKLKLLWEQRNKKDGPSQFVPTNMAVNFVQHNRFNIEDSAPNKAQKGAVPPKEPKPEGPPKSGKRSQDSTEKATDDYHFERFKKQYRRY